eukprot:s1162_g23.t1
MFVFAHLRRSAVTRGAGLLVEIGSFNSALHSLPGTYVFQIRPIKREVVLRLSQTRWKTAPSRCSCRSRQADSMSGQSLERFSIDVGANDTFICDGIPPIVTIEGRLRRLSCPVGDVCKPTRKCPVPLCKR